MKTLERGPTPYSSRIVSIVPEGIQTLHNKSRTQAFSTLQLRFLTHTL